MALDLCLDFGHRLQDGALGAALAGLVIEKCAMPVVSVAPCQCFSPSGIT